VAYQEFDQRFLDANHHVFGPADGIDPKQVVYGFNNGQRVNHLIVSSTSASAHDMVIDASTGQGAIIACVTIPANAGYTPANPPIDLIASLPAGMVAINVTPGREIHLRLLVALGAGETITVYDDIGDY